MRHKKLGIPVRAREEIRAKANAALAILDGAAPAVIPAVTNIS